jgi:hypothetical protein
MASFGVIIWIRVIILSQNILSNENTVGYCHNKFFTALTLVNLIYYLKY